MTVRAALGSDTIDLAVLVRQFPAPGEPTVDADAEGTYLTSATFPDSPLGEANALHAQALTLLTLVNGAARIADPTFHPVELVGNFRDASGQQHAVVVADARDYLELPIRRGRLASDT